jgi:hypothetical protein
LYKTKSWGYDGMEKYVGSGIGGGVDRECLGAKQ